MVRKVEFFEEEYISTLQNNINKFLDKLPQYNVVDVKYNHYRDHNMWYTALVIYSDNKEPDCNSDGTVPTEVGNGRKKRTMIPTWEGKDL